MPRKIIGLIGPAGSGKSTLAVALNDFNFYHYPMAGALKDMLTALFKYQGMTDAEVWSMLYGNNKEEATKFLDGKTPRLAMQTLGTEWRNMISKNLWVNAWERRVEATAKNKKIVVEDVRFQHEVDAIARYNGFIVLVRREGYGPSEHASEKDYMEVVPNFTVDNIGDDPQMMKRQLVDKLGSWLTEK